MALTIEPGVLRVGAAMPDPPFEIPGATPSGFDIAFMQAVAGELGLRWRLVRFQGADFNAIFAGLADGAWDCVASGATVTPERERVAAFCAPYLNSGQALACNLERTPGARSVDDLRGLVLGVQDGNTSEPVARRLRAEGRVADVRVYPYHAIGTMLDDLAAGRLGAVMKLAPVLRWLTRDRPALRVVQQGLTEEAIAVAVALGNAGLRTAIDAARARLAARGVLAELARAWRLA
jgi:ABC-type amino acid transport substrate-binding protein